MVRKSRERISTLARGCRNTFGIYITFIEGVAGKLLHLHLHFARRLSATNLASLGAKAADS
jgi:hypothetical protein